MATQRASAALLSRIAQAALNEFRDPDLYVTQAPVGVLLDDAHLQLLQKAETERLDDPGSVARLVEISQIVDCIQTRGEFVNTPAEDPRYLSDVFPRLMQNVRFSSAPLDADGRAHYAAAQSVLFEQPPFIKTPAYTEFCVLRSDLEKKDVALAEMRANRARLPDGEERTALDAELLELELLRNEQREMLSALDRSNAFTVAEQLVDAAEREIDALPPSVDLALSTIELLRVGAPGSLMTHICCSFFPSQLGEDNWAPLELTRADIERGSAEGAHRGATDSEDMDDAQIDSVELEVQTAVCERPWLWSALFENLNWQWSAPSAPISSPGDLDQDEGLIPGYVHALIFARRLTVRGRFLTNAKGAPAAAAGRASLLMRALASPKPVAAAAKAGAAAAAAPAKAAAAAKAAQAAAKAGAAAAKAATVAAPKAALAATPSKVALSPAPKTAAAAAPMARSTSAVASAPQVRLATAAKLVKPKLSEVIHTLPAGAVTLSKATPRQNVSPAALEALRRAVRKTPLYTATGRVVDEKGQGVYRASVTLALDVGSRRVLTAQDGSFSLASLNAGSYRLEVGKAGATTQRVSLAIPQKVPVQVRLPQPAVCQVQVQLIEQTDAGERPFSGQVRVAIRAATGSVRLESMVQQSQARFALAPGSYQVSITSPEAERVSPSNASIRLVTGAAATVVSFRIRAAPILHNPGVQLLGFVCRRVPACPGARRD